MISYRALLLASIFQAATLTPSDQDTTVFVKAKLKTGPPSLTILVVKKLFEMFDPSSSLAPIDLLQKITDGGLKDLGNELQEDIKTLALDPYPDQTGGYKILLDLTTALPPFTLPPFDDRENVVRLSPDKNYACYVAKDPVGTQGGALVLFDGRKKTAQSITHPGIFRSESQAYNTRLTFSKDSAAVFFKDYRDGNHTLYCYTIHDDTLREHAQVPEMVYYQKIFISHSGKSILFKSPNGLSSTLLNIDKNTRIVIPEVVFKLNKHSTHFITKSEGSGDDSSDDDSSDDDSSDDDSSDDSKSPTYQISCYSIEGKHLFSRTCNKYTEAFFDRTGSQLITAHNNQVSISEVETGALLKQIIYSSYIFPVRHPCSNTKLITFYFRGKSYSDFLITDQDTGRYVTISKGILSKLYNPQGLFEQYYYPRSLAGATLSEIFKFLLVERHSREKKEIPSNLIADLAKSKSQCIQDFLKHRSSLMLKNSLTYFGQSFNLETARRFKPEQKAIWRLFPAPPCF